MHYYDEEENNIYKSIEDYKKLISKKENEIKELEIIKASLTASMIKQIRSIHTPFLTDMLFAAFKEQHATKKSERKNYEYIKNKLIKECIPEDKQKDVKLTSIVSGGWESYAYNFNFSYKKINFEITIPVPTKATAENIWYISYGKYTVSYQSSACSWEQITASYNLNNIKTTLEEFLSSHE